MSPSPKRLRSTAPFSSLTNDIFIYILHFLPIQNLATQIIPLQSRQISDILHRIILSGDFFKVRESHHFRDVLFGNQSDEEKLGSDFVHLASMRQLSSGLPSSRGFVQPPRGGAVSREIIEPKRFLSAVCRGFPTYYHDICTILQMSSCEFFHGLGPLLLQQALIFTKYCDVPISAYLAMWDAVGGKDCGKLERRASRALESLLQLPILKSDRTLLLEFILFDAGLYELAAERLKQDESFVREALDTNQSVWYHLEAHDREDKELIRHLVNEVPKCYLKCDQLFRSNAIKKDKEFMMEMIERVGKEAYWGMDYAFCEHPDVVEHALQHGVPGIAIVDRAMRIAYDEPNSSSVALNHLLGDREMVRRLIKNGISPHIPVEKLDKDMLLEAFQDPEFKWNAARLSDILSLNPSLLNDRSIMQHAVAKLDSDHPLPSWVLSDRELMLIAIREGNAKMFQRVSMELRADRELAFEACKRNPSLFVSASVTLHTDRQLILDIAKENGAILDHCPSHLRSDREIVQLCVQKSSRALEFASPELQADESIIAEAMKDDPKTALKYATFPYRNNLPIALAAAQSDVSIMTQFSPEIQCNPSLIAEALKCGNLEDLVNVWEESIGRMDPALENIGRMEPVLADLIQEFSMPPATPTPLTTRPLHPLDKNDLMVYVCTFLTLETVTTTMRLLNRELRLHIGRSFLNGTFFKLREKECYREVLFGDDLLDAVPRDNKVRFTSGSNATRFPMANLRCGFPSFYADHFRMLKESHVPLFASVLKSRVIQQICNHTLGMEFDVDKYIGIRSEMWDLGAGLQSEWARLLFQVPIFASDHNLVVQLGVQGVDDFYLCASPELRQKKGFVCEALRRDRLILQCVSQELLRDVDVLLSADGANREIPTDLHPEIDLMQYVPEEYRSNRDFAIKFIAKHPSLVLQFAPTLIVQRDFWLDIVRACPEVYVYCPEQFRHDLEIIKASLEKGCAILHVVDAQLITRELLLFAAEHNSLLIEDLPVQYQNDREFAKSVLSLRGDFLAFFSDALKKDKELVLLAVKSNGLALRSAHYEMQIDSDVVAAACAENPRALEFVPQHMRDRNILKIAMRSTKNATVPVDATSWWIDYFQRGYLLEVAPRGLEKDVEMLSCVVECLVDTRHFMSFIELLVGQRWRR